MTCDEKNICKTDCGYSLEVSECEGDLDPALREIIKACKSAGLEMSFDITHFEDEEGGYIYQNGVYETLGREDLCLRTVSDRALFAEIRRRGLTQENLWRSVSNDLIFIGNAINRYSRNGENQK